MEKDFTITFGLFNDNVIEFDRGEQLDIEKLEELVRHCVDMDSWKHSWHKNVRNKDTWIELIKILNDKIRIRKHDIDMISQCITQMNMELNKD